MASESNESKLIDVDEWEAKGLIGHSYDVVFTIQKRMRKISDYTFSRRGLTMPQLGTFFLTLLLSLLVFMFVIGPVTRLFLGGHNMPWYMLIIFIVGPAFLASQQVSKPLPFKKSVSSFITSFFRYITDEKVHRRGKPVHLSNAELEGTPTISYARMWDAAPSFRELYPNARVSDPATERKFSGLFMDLDTWLAQQQVDNAAAREAATPTEQDQPKYRGYSRGDISTRIH